MRRARVIATHRAPDRLPIRVAKGDTVTLGERDTDWTDFVWTSVAEGHGGWVPAILFEDQGHGPATALHDYDTRELDADAGAILSLHHELAGWWWAENDNGAQGWIPARNLQFIEENRA